jgi:hypothetical protein
MSRGMGDWLWIMGNVVGASLAKTIAVSFEVPDSPRLSFESIADVALLGTRFN